uniref:Putative secreted protein n=1 Tax=Anopheles darlingi TaxID=43151 RepID=A0A2M4DGL0_ANODA
MPFRMLFRMLFRGAFGARAFGLRSVVRLCAFQASKCGAAGKPTFHQSVSTAFECFRFLERGNDATKRREGERHFSGQRPCWCYDEKISFKLSFFSEIETNFKIDMS